MPMRSHIDWVTFTMSPRYDMVLGENLSVDETYAEAIRQAFELMFGHELMGKAFGGNWEKNERSRAPYTDAWTMVNRGITLFASPSLTHCCVEISGEGCEILIREESLHKVLQSCCNRTTRIDIATDILTDTSPTEFVAAISHNRMRSSGFVKSETGETCYVGSKKSDRYARVYRYAKPHPRASLLRVEGVFRREQAEIAVRHILTNGLESTAQASANVFGWAHRSWEPLDKLVIFDNAVKVEREGGKTVLWLIAAAGGAFRRLVANGTITNPEQFLERYFMSE